MEIEIEEQSHYLNVRKNTFVFLICFFNPFTLFESHFLHLF